MHIQRNVLILIGLIIILAMFSACNKEQQVSPVEQVLMNKCEELFGRIKVGDYEVIYENEFPYLHEKLDLEQFLNDRYLKWYNPDTLIAVQIDSATVWDDTAYVHMQLEYIHSDSSYSVTAINLRWWKIDDEWIKPTRSDHENQLVFEEELRIYWEAVEEMQAREKKQEKQGDSL